MRTVRLTDEEIHLIDHALTIASEDGSIYPTMMDQSRQDASDKSTNTMIEGIRKKLLG